MEKESKKGMSKRIISAVLTAALILGFFAGVPLRANAVTQMSVSEECVEFIKNIEGFYAIPYWDYAQWTVGFGTKCPDEYRQKYLEEGIPLEEAEKLLEKAMVYFGNEVNKFMVRNKIQLTQQQFDALFSLSYNIGPAWLYDTDNRLVQSVLAGGNGNELVYLMGLRCNAGGKFLPALLNRRIMEADMFLNGRYDSQVHSDYGTVLYDAGSGKCEARGQGYDMNLPATPLAVPTYDGYRFLGWFTAKTGGVRVTELDRTTNGMTLYAHWEKISDVSGSTPVENLSVKVQASALYVRTGPGVDYSIATSVSKGTQLVITETVERNGSLWGKCSKGWISLAYTDYKPAQQPADEEEKLELPVMATVLNPKGISIYKGPHSTYPMNGTIKVWEQIEVTEVKAFMGQTWAKTARGWIRVDKNLMLHDKTTLAHFVDVTVTNNYLNVRTGPGTEYALSGSLEKDDQVKIVAVEKVGSALWGRCAKGWISLQYTSFDESKLSSYQNHTFGAWEDVKTATCTSEGQQKRGCVDCAYVETRVSPKAEHQFGDWYTVGTSTYNDPGKERRDCRVCGAYETRETGVIEQPEIHIYGTVTGCDVLNVRANAGTGNALVGTLKRGQRVEILEQTTVNGKGWGRTEAGWICITGYVTLEVVENPQPDVTEEKVYGTLTGYHTLNIRENAGTQYALVGTLKQGERVEILEQKTVGTKVWGRIDRGWICLTGYMTLETVKGEEPEQPQQPEKLVMTVTATSLTIRSGAGTGYSVVGYLSGGQQVEVLEQKTVDGKTWARIDRGWVSMKYLN